jgi:NAD(P)-dependent dehydrogenase (short-subunit alcohol dehydrogenase family)
VDIGESALQKTLGFAGVKTDRLSIHSVDITNQAAVAALPEQVIARHGAMDSIINNAGIIQPLYG